MRSQEEVNYKQASLQYDIELDEDTDINPVQSTDSEKMSEEDKYEEVEVTERNEKTKKKRKSMYKKQVKESLTQYILKLCTTADLELNVAVYVAMVHIGRFLN